MPPTSFQDRREPGDGRIVAASDVMRDLLARLRQVARSEAKILITGETGVGKELIARYIHAQSPRHQHAFVAVNCAGVPDTLLESELFGHVKGSFTGAYRDRPGKFEIAHNGTLFLDEVGEMTLRMQGLVLRAVERGEMQKVGADATARVDCRIVTATHRNLEQMVETGQFREDLYYRLNVISVRIPPLRERPEDLPVLADHFLRIYSDPSAARCFTPDAMRVLQAYAWPGNVRQLENLAQRLAMAGETGPIDVADLPADLLHLHPSTVLREHSATRRSTTPDLLYDRLKRGADFWTAVHGPYEEHEITRADLRAVIERGLQECRGNYRLMTKMFNLPTSDYHRLMNFLRKERVLLPFRQYRVASAADPRAELPDPQVQRRRPADDD